MDIYDHIMDIKNASGANEKKKVIQNFFLDAPVHCLDLMMRVVEATYKQGVAYHITKIEPTIPKPMNMLFGEIESRKCRYRLVEGLQYLQILNEKGSANGNDIKHLNEMCGLMDKDDVEVLRLVIDRNLKCGAGIKAFRAVYGNDFCPDFPKMLCSSFNLDKIAKNIEFPAYSQLKSDGARCMFDVRRDKAFSRNGKEYLNLPEYMLREIQEIFSSNLDVIIDGELVVVDEFDDILPRETGYGILTKSIKGTISAEEAMNIRFVVWDLIHSKDFYGQDTPETPYEHRFNHLINHIDDAESVYLIPTENRVVNSIDEAIDNYIEMVERGEEGTIL